jgi:2'-5' RNA ligase
MPPDQFHVTAVFLGSQPADTLEWIRETTERVVSEARCPIFRVERYRETSRVGMVTLREDVLPGDHYAGRGSEAVGRLMLAFEAEGIYKREHREWRPHITVARFREAPRLTLQPPSLLPFQPTDVTLFQSILRSKGSTYVGLGSYGFRAEA